MKRILSVGVCLAPLVFATPLAAEEPPGGPLAAYVGRADDSYHWVKRREGELEGGSYVELTLTSQTWRDIVWRHQLFILKPSELRDPSRALLVIGGGAWRDELAEPDDSKAAGLPRDTAFFTALADEIKAPVAVLLHVPQQPIFDGMVEDEIISYTFDQFLKTRDATWPLLLPMVKSAVRGMDAVQEVARQEWSIEIEHFTLTGASKRGWTTWLTAAVDSRVQSLAPMVIDVLNMGPQMEHQMESWGRYSDEIEDYTRLGIQQRMASGAGQRLGTIVDPYSYRQALTQPKLILLGTNDRYWPLDALNLYWDGLVGERHVLYVPNNGHSLRDFERVVGTIAALHRQAAGELKLAKLTWELDEGDRRLKLALKSDVKPAKVSAWTAASATRDFRDAQWSSRPAELVEGAYRHDLELPAQGYAAMFGEAVFETDGLPYFLSTNVKIVRAQAR